VQTRKEKNDQLEQFGLIWRCPGKTGLDRFWKPAWYVQSKLAQAGFGRVPTVFSRNQPRDVLAVRA